MAKDYLSFDGGLIVFKESGSFYGAGGLIEYGSTVKITLLDKDFKVPADQFFSMIDACNNPKNKALLETARKNLTESVTEVFDTKIKENTQEVKAKA